MKNVLLLLFSVVLSVSAFPQEKSQLSPVFRYSNWGGYFSPDRDELVVYEAVYDSVNNRLAGYSVRKLYLGLEVKGRVLNSETFYLEEFSPGFIGIQNQSDTENFISSLGDKIRTGDGKFNLEYSGTRFVLEYDNTGISAQQIRIRRDNESKVLFELPAFYIWHKLSGSYLVIAGHSQGGSGHTIVLTIFNLADAAGG